MSISEIEREQELICDYVRRKGLIMSNSYDCQRQFCELYENTLKPVFLEEIVQSNLRSIFTYQQSGQKVEEFRRADGEAFRFTSPDGKKDIGAIGIAEEVFGRGNQYIAFIFLHELVHLYFWDEDHTENFHSVLDGFLIRCNAVTGWNLKNDYYGLLGDDYIKPANNDDAEETARRPISGSTDPRDAREVPTTTEHVKQHDRISSTGKMSVVREHDRKKPTNTATAKAHSTMQYVSRADSMPIPAEWSKAWKC